MASSELDGPWPTWTSEDKPACNSWFIRQILKPLCAKVKQKWPSCTPQLLLSSIDMIRLTGLAHYKCGGLEDWNHEFVVANICLEDWDNEQPDLKLCMLYERTLPAIDDPDCEKKRDIKAAKSIPTQADDRVKFLYSKEVDDHLESIKSVSKLSDCTMEISGQHVSFLQLGFIMAAHSLNFPEYTVTSNMCYWYAGSTLDCVSLAMHEAITKGSRFISQSLYCEDHIRSGVLSLPGVTLKGYESKWNRGSDELVTPPPRDAGIEKLLHEAEENARQFSVYNILGGNSASQFRERTDFNAECHRIFTQHLVMKDPIKVDKGKSGIWLRPEPIPGRLLLQEDIIGSDDDARSLIEEARKVFYGENRFHIWLDAFREFSKGSYGNTNSDANIAPLLRNITVMIPVPYNDEEHNTESRADGSIENMRYHGGRMMPRQWSEQRLHDLLRCTSDSGIKIKILFSGFGVLDGSDLATHRIIKDVALEVKKIINKFPGTEVYKSLIRNDDELSPRREKDLTSYWDTPTEGAKKAVECGSGEFQQVVQCEIEEWSAPRGT